MECAVGIDIGGTAIKFAVVRKDGSLIDTLSLPTRAQDDPQQTITRITDAVNTLLEKARGIDPDLERVLAVGVGCAGLISTDSGVVHLSPNLPHWREVPLGPETSKRLGMPVLLHNDANAFVLGESWAGAGRGVRVLLGLTLGTGVGGGVVIDGNLFTGSHGFAGELGHTPLFADGPPCGCGSRGCLEIYVGNRAIVDRYLEISEGRRGPVVERLTAGDEGLLNPELLCRAAHAGDACARETFEITGRHLGAGLAGLANLFDPERIVIGGGVAQAGNLLLDPARAALAERSMYPKAFHPEVRSAALGEQAGVIGVALESLDRFDRGESLRYE